MTPGEFKAALKDAFENGEWAEAWDEGTTAKRPLWYTNSEGTYFEQWLKYVYPDLVDL